MDSQTRTDVIKKNILLSILVKGSSVLISFLLVRFCLEYLDGYEYGLWLTISSVLAWFNLFNIGLGHGLRNRLAEAMSVNDTKKAKIYVSTTYAILGLISLSLIVVFAIISPFINWDLVFNITETISAPIFYIVALVFVSVCLRFFIGLITIILTALHRIALADFILLLSNIIVLLGLYYLKENTMGSILSVAILYTLTPIVVLLIANIFYFKVSYQTISPSFSAIDLSKSKDLISLGFKFFVIQIAAVVLFSTDNMIITHLFTAEEVTPYNLSLRYFSIVTLGFSTLAAPFWSGITDAVKKKDYQWVNQAIKKLTFIWIGIIPICILMLFIVNPFFNFWLKDVIKVDLSLHIAMCTYVILINWCVIFNQFYNGTGDLKILMGTSIFSIIINIPLSIFFAGVLNWGLEGILMATIVCQILPATLLPIYYLKWYKGLKSEDEINLETPLI